MFCLILLILFVVFLTLGSVLGPFKVCLYLLPLSAILWHHNIGCHVYAEDTQLYVSFKC